MSNKTPKIFQGAKVIHGLGMVTHEIEALEDNSLSQFDAREECWLVLPDGVLEEGALSVNPRGFTDKELAIRYAQACANGNIDYRVLRVTEQILVVATEHKL